MFDDINIVTLLGRATDDPKIVNTTNGSIILKFCLANNESYKQGEQWVKNTNFININVFGKLAEYYSKHLKKGSLMAVTGSLKQNKWQDKKTGENRSTLEITAKEINFLSPLKKETNESQINTSDPWEQS